VRICQHDNETQIKDKLKLRKLLPSDEKPKKYINRDSGKVLKDKME